jgi:hypothetical protein
MPMNTVQKIKNIAFIFVAISRMSNRKNEKKNVIPVYGKVLFVTLVRL